MGENADVEDVVQEALTRAWRHADACQATDPAPWALAITRREVWRRHASRHDWPLPDELESAATEPDSWAIHERLDVQRALSSLSRDDGLLLHLRYELDMTQPAIARALGVPEGTTKVRLHRARERLRARMEDTE